MDTPTPPTITSPVARYLSVADPARSIAFYRDILGFAEHPVTEGYGVPVVADLTRGQARLLLTDEDSADDSTGRRQPRGAAIVFLSVDRVGALHAEVTARGGKPTPLQRANGLKQELFLMKDPDGHTLWFGASTAEPVGEAPPPALRQVMPSFPLSDVAAGVAYYRDVLGFSVNYAQEDIGVMDRDAVRILLVARQAEHTGTSACCIYVEDADALYAELRERGARVEGEPVSMPWGLREFGVRDLEGNRITLAQTFE